MKLLPYLAAVVTSFAVVAALIGPSHAWRMCPLGHCGCGPTDFWRDCVERDPELEPPREWCSKGVDYSAGGVFDDLSFGAIVSGDTFPASGRLGDPGPLEVEEGGSRQACMQHCVVKERCSVTTGWGLGLGWDVRRVEASCGSFCLAICAPLPE